MTVFELDPCDMIKAPKNTFKYTVFQLILVCIYFFKCKFSCILLESSNNLVICLYVFFVYIFIVKRLPNLG